MMLDARFEKALRSDDRVITLRQLAQNLLDEGRSREAVQTEFEQVRQQLRDAGREDEEDAVMDVMDLLSGWCNPHMRFAE